MMRTSPKKNKLIGLWADVLNVTRKRGDIHVHVMESEVQTICVAMSYQCPLQTNMITNIHFCTNQNQIKYLSIQSWSHRGQ